MHRCWIHKNKERTKLQVNVAMYTTVIVHVEHHNVCLFLSFSAIFFRVKRFSKDTQISSIGITHIDGLSTATVVCVEESIMWLGDRYDRRVTNLSGDTSNPQRSAHTHEHAHRHRYRQTDGQTDAWTQMKTYAGDGMRPWSLRSSPIDASKAINRVKGFILCRYPLQ